MEDDSRFEISKFEVVFTDDQKKVVEGTRMISRTSGGVTILNENKNTRSEEGDLQPYSVITVPEQTLKYAYEMNSDSDSDSTGSPGDKWEDGDVFENDSSENGNVENNSDNGEDTDEESVWDEDIEIDDDIEI